MRDTGNKHTETIRHAIEDPMNMFVESKSQARQDKYARVEHLKVNFFSQALSDHVPSANRSQRCSAAG